MMGGGGGGRLLKDTSQLWLVVYKVPFPHECVLCLRYATPDGIVLQIKEQYFLACGFVILC